MKSEREAVAANSGLVAATPVYPESWCPAPGREPWQGPQADLIPSCCRMLVGRGSDSGRAVTADAGLQKPAERGAHRLRQSQLVPFTPKALRPATRAIAAKKQRGHSASGLGLWFSRFGSDSSEPRPRPRPQSPALCPSPGARPLEPRPAPPLGPRPQPGGMGPAHQNRSLEIRPVPAVLFGLVRL